MSLAVNQHYGSQATVRNHYYGSRLYQPNPYPHGSRPQKRTWDKYTFPNPTNPAYPLAFHVPIYPHWPIPAPPAPIIINNCACSRSAPINASIPAPGPTQPPEAVHPDSGATAPLNKFDVQQSAEPGVVKPVTLGTAHQPTGVRARDILPTVRPPRGTRVETPPPPPPPRRSKRHDMAYGDIHSFAGGITSVHRYSAGDETGAPTVSQDYGPYYDRIVEYEAPSTKPHILGGQVRNATPTERSPEGSNMFLNPPSSPLHWRSPHSFSTHRAWSSAGRAAVPGSPGHTPFVSSAMVAESAVASHHAVENIERRATMNTNEGAKDPEKLSYSRPAHVNRGFTPNLDSLSRLRQEAARSPAVPQLREHQSYSPPNLSHKPFSATRLVG